MIENAVRQRRAVRFRLHLPVIFRWNDRLRMKQELSGHTRDLSISDLFVLCPAPLPVGTIVELKVHIPALEKYSFQGLMLRRKEKSSGSGDQKKRAGLLRLQLAISCCTSEDKLKVTAHRNGSFLQTYAKSCIQHHAVAHEAIMP